MASIHEAWKTYPFLVEAPHVGQYKVYPPLPDIANNFIIVTLSWLLQKRSL